MITFRGNDNETTRYGCERIRTLCRYTCNQSSWFASILFQGPDRIKAPLSSSTIGKSGSWWMATTPCAATAAEVPNNGTLEFSSIIKYHKSVDIACHQSVVSDSRTYFCLCYETRPIVVPLHSLCDERAAQHLPFYPKHEALLLPPTSKIIAR